ncbi:hypothetical protein BMS3Bbin02_01175 [bacterium BMS3Bbin02]|nr:hypothetical protein BMS3Bbin02_01175 [bacterium BMS3Bbin02]HDH25804.1 hypothetical protein [Actinomycetota bacterium]
MKSGPIRRLIAAAGLITLIPLALSLFQGSVTLVDAAQRGVLTLVAVIVANRIASAGVRVMAQSMDREAQAVTNRRSTDVAG